MTLLLNWFLDVWNVPCTVVVPQQTPKIKCDAIKGYGAELVLCETPALRKVTCDKISVESGRQIIHPFDDVDVIAGQGEKSLSFEISLVNFGFILHNYTSIFKNSQFSDVSSLIKLNGEEYEKVGWREV